VFKNIVYGVLLFFAAPVVEAGTVWAWYSYNAPAKSMLPAAMECVAGGDWYTSSPDNVVCRVGGSCISFSDESWRCPNPSLTVVDACLQLTTCLSAGTPCPVGTSPLGAYTCAADCTVGNIHNAVTGVCEPIPCVAGEAHAGYAATATTQVFGNCRYEPDPGAQQETITSGPFSGIHTTWLGTGVFDSGADTLTTCDGLECCMDMTEGSGFESSLAFLYCEEFWTEEVNNTESYYNYGP